MIPVHFLHVHIGMLHGMLLAGRSTVFFELPSFIDFHPVVGIELFEGSNEGFLTCIKADILENSCDLVFLSAYKAAHFEHLIHIQDEIQNSHRTALDLEVTPSAEPNMLIYEIGITPYLVV